MNKKSIFRGDNVDEIITQRKLDQHPEFLNPLIKEHRLDKWIAGLEDQGLIVLHPLMRSRVLNFIEAAVRADMHVDERRLGVALAVIISCVDIDQKRHDMPLAIDGLMPVHLLTRKNYGKFAPTDFTEAHVERIKEGVRAFRSYHPSIGTFKNSRLLLILRDACMAWIGTGDREVRHFHLFTYNKVRLDSSGKHHHRYEAQRSLQFSIDASKIERALQSPYAIFGMTQWGTARSFEHNYPQKLKEMSKERFPTYA